MDGQNKNSMRKLTSRVQELLPWWSPAPKQDISSVASPCIHGPLPISKDDGSTTQMPFFSLSIPKRRCTRWRNLRKPFTLAAHMALSSGTLTFKFSSMGNRSLRYANATLITKRRRTRSLMMERKTTAWPEKERVKPIRHLNAPCWKYSALSSLVEL